MKTIDIPDELAKFKIWAKAQGYQMNYVNEKFIYSDANRAWSAWLARARA